MTEEYEFLDSTYLGANSHTFTLPKKVREFLNIKKPEGAIGFFRLKKGDITIGLSGENIIVTSNFSPTFGLTLRDAVRKILKINKGDPIIFYTYNEKVVMRKGKKRNI